MKKNNEKKILVYADWEEQPAPALMGKLVASVIRGKEVFSFEYDDNWLTNNSALYLDPDLSMYKGRQYLADVKHNFGIFLDSSPDRWGRVLMKRREAIIARQENRKEETLYESDFLLGVFDKHRLGGLRFKLDEESAFLNDNKDMATPPWTALRTLEHASMKFEESEDDEDDESLKWLEMLLAPGSSLGGARPKASVMDTKGALWIAKFPSKNDDNDIGAWEMAAHRIAQKAGVIVPEAKAMAFSGGYHTFLSKRFDRNAEGKRIHFASAMTLLGYTDGDNHTAGVSYLELAEFIQRYGAEPDTDLEQLWRRIVLNICISNTDDHLRNHGFLLTTKGWLLAPAYDINPVAHAYGLTLNISETSNALSIDLAMEVAQYFRVPKDRATFIVNEVTTNVSQWKLIATDLGISKRQSDILASAFNYG